MLVTKYEWQLDAFEDMTRAPMGSWAAISISYETAPFLMHSAGMTFDGEPISVLVPSIGVLLEELDGLPLGTLERVVVEILSPTRGSQAVRELWAYESGDDNALHYAYVGQGGIMEPCNPSQPRTMTNLKRKFVLRGGEASAEGPAAQMSLEVTASPWAS